MTTGWIIMSPYSSLKMVFVREIGIWLCNLTLHTQLVATRNLLTLRRAGSESSSPTSFFTKQL